MSGCIRKKNLEKNYFTVFAKFNPISVAQAIYNAIYHTTGYQS